MGDLNLHLPIETNYIYENGFIDLWLEKYVSEDKLEKLSKESENLIKK